GDQTTDAPGAAVSTPQAMGTEHKQTRGCGQPRRERLRTAYKTRSKELYQELWKYQLTLEAQDLPEYVFRQKMKERKAEIDAELEPLGSKEWEAYRQCNKEFEKQERYCREQREVLRALEDLKEQERTMYELDSRKDH